MSAITSIDPRTGEPFGEGFPPTSAAAVSALSADAAAAAPHFEAQGRLFRARLLRTIGAALEARRDDIVATAEAETGKGELPLGGELSRTVNQAGLFAEVLAEGSYVEAAIDHAVASPPGPDLRRMLVPTGPVAVFGAGNFPLAFSVPGGDTVSALAAGCPVIVKAHESHPATSQLTYDIMRQAAADAGADARILGIVYGREAGGALVADPNITAVGFTGSLRGGRALLDIVNARSRPIPFYGELSSLNPVVVTPAAARQRATAIATGLVDSVTTGAGQLCTKPGLVFVPAGTDGDAFVQAAAALVDGVSAPVALNAGIATAYKDKWARLTSSAAASIAAEGRAYDQAGFGMVPRLVTLDAGELSAEMAEECFGPMTIVVRYGDRSELNQALNRLPSSLTGTIHSEQEEEQLATELTHALRARAGRVLYDGFPTGVRVSWAQNHGGPWPSTNTLHTSVGASAIRRFLRPVTWQNAPQYVLPAELHDDATEIPRRVDGALVLPDQARGNYAEQSV